MPEGQDWMQAVAAAVHRELDAFFDEKAAALAAMAPSAALMLDEIRDLTMRGGKRLRAILVAAGHRAARPASDPAETALVGASVEVLQTALLIHDDWMDQDEVRRGGPAVHASLRRKLGDAHRGDAVGILAGDYATSLALDLFARAPYLAARRDEATRAFLSILEEVYVGQLLDLIESEEVSRMHRLKTTSYTVLGPLRLGALLGDAPREVLETLERWAIPIGEAFQIRDDLLGTLGDPRATGKPGEDLRHGKRTALLDEARASGSPALSARLDQVVGRAEASDESVAELVTELEREGVVARVEARLEARVDEASAIAQTSSLGPESRRDLRALGEMLGRRRA